MKVKFPSMAFRAICGLAVTAAAIPVQSPAAAQERRAPAAVGRWHLHLLVPPSSFHTINGLALDRRGNLYAGSVSGASIFRTSDFKRVETVVPPPLGQADDLVVMPDGALIWTVIRDGIVRRRDRDGAIRDIATGIAGVNPIALSPDGRRLFVGQMLYGDSLWEVDPEGRKPARRLVEGIGWLNGFAFGKDGRLYAPIYSKGEVVRIDPDKGTVEILASGFEHPTSVRVGRDGSLFVLESPTGDVWRVKDGKRRVVAKLPTGLDNFVVRPDGSLLISNMGDGSITSLDPASGRSKSLMRARLAFPVDLAVGGSRLLVADTYTLRSVDRTTGAITDVLRPVVSGLYPATALSVAHGKAVLSSEMLGAVQLVDIASGRLENTVRGVEGAVDAVRTRDGRLFAVLAAKGELVELTSGGRQVIAKGLRMPVAVEDAGDGTVLVAESGSGSLTAVNLADGSSRIVATGLGRPRAIAIGSRGYAVLDAGTRRIWWVDKASGKPSLVARDMPVGYLREPFPRSGGIALADDSTIYVAADADNAVYVLKR